MGYVFIFQISMTVHENDSVVKGEVARQSHHTSSEGSKVHRGM